MKYASREVASNLGSRNKLFWNRFFAAVLFLFFFIDPLLFVSGYIEGKLFCTIYNLPKVFFIAAGGLLLVSLWLFYLSCCREMVDKSLDFLRRNLGMHLIFLLLVWMGVSLYTAAVPEVAGAAFVIYLLLGLLGLVLSLMFLSASLRWAAIWGLLAGFAGFTVLGLIQAAGVKLSFMLPIQWWRPASTFANRNIAAQFIVFGLPFLFFAVGKSWQSGRMSERKRWYGLLAGLLAVAAGALVLLFINASKNGLLALVVQVLYLPLAWFWFRVSRRQNSERYRRLLKLIAGALAGVILVLSIALTVPQTRGRMLQSWRLFQQKGVTGVLRARYLFWRNTLIMIKDHPLTGVGIGNFRIVYPLYSRSFAWDTVTSNRKQVRKAHNDYLQLAAECGIPALVLFIIILGRQFYLLRIPEAGEDGEGRIADEWRLPLGASLLAYAVVMCFSFPLQLAYSRMFFFFLIALGEARAWRASLK